MQHCLAHPPAPNRLTCPCRIFQCHTPCLLHHSDVQIAALAFSELAALAITSCCFHVRMCMRDHTAHACVSPFWLTWWGPAPTRTHQQPPDVQCSILAHGGTTDAPTLPQCCHCQFDLRCTLRRTFHLLPDHVHTCTRDHTAHVCVSPNWLTRWGPAPTCTHQTHSRCTAQH